jgi:hypothetical protein
MYLCKKSSFKKDRLWSNALGSNKHLVKEFSNAWSDDVSWRFPDSQLHSFEYQAVCGGLSSASLNSINLREIGVGA